MLETSLGRLRLKMPSSSLPGCHFIISGSEVIIFRQDVVTFSLFDFFAFFSFLLFLSLAWPSRSSESRLRFLASGGCDDCGSPRAEMSNSGPFSAYNYRLPSHAVITRQKKNCLHKLKKRKIKCVRPGFICILASAIQLLGKCILAGRLL